MLVAEVAMLFIQNKPLKGKICGKIFEAMKEGRNDWLRTEKGNPKRPKFWFQKAPQREDFGKFLRP
jgi:hypothetical protein